MKKISGGIFEIVPAEISVGTQGDISGGSVGEISKRNYFMNSDNHS